MCVCEYACVFVCVHIYVWYVYVCVCMHIFLMKYASINFKVFIKFLWGIRLFPGTLFLLQLDLVMDTRETDSLDVSLENNLGGSQDSDILETP